jgi:hypothetical protein
MLVYLDDGMTWAYSSLASVLVAVILNRRAGLTWKVFMTPRSQRCWPFLRDNQRASGTSSRFTLELRKSKVLFHQGL